MSSRRLPVVLSPEARDNFEDIVRYTRRTWGDGQAARYAEALNNALDNLGRFPLMGRARDDVFPGCRIQPVEQHVILYETDDIEVRVARILHAKMDIFRQF